MAPRLREEDTISAINSFKIFGYYLASRRNKWALYYILSCTKPQNMKNLFLFLPVLMITLMAVSSCKKDTVTNTVTVHDTVAPAPSIVGYWPGKFAVTASPQTYPVQPLSFLFEANGTVVVYGRSADTTSATTLKGYGTYTVSGLTVTTSFFYNGSQQLSTTATVDSLFTFSQGTVGTSPATSGDDVFFNYKQ